jgi:hypothetical protein
MISLNSICDLVFMLEILLVFYAVGTEISKLFRRALKFQRANIMTSISFPDLKSLYISKGVSIKVVNLYSFRLPG